MHSYSVAKWMSHLPMITTKIPKLKLEVQVTFFHFFSVQFTV